MKIKEEDERRKESPIRRSGLRIGSGCRIGDSRFGIEDSGLRIRDSGLRMKD
jgi:hypothetical protein